MENRNKFNLSTFKVLLVYANVPMEPLMPLGVATLSTVLQEAGAQVKIFDTTFYQEQGEGKKEREQSLQVIPTNYSTVGIESISRNIVKDFSETIDEFRPNLIGFSCVEVTFPTVIKLLSVLESIDIPVIVGGSFATFAPEFILSHDRIDMVCIGDGEISVCRLADCLAHKMDISGIPNIWHKRDNKLVSPTTLKLMDVNRLPHADFRLFPEKRIFRPMDGKFYRMLPLEFSRGCPYNCPYCSAPYYSEVFKSYGKWFRHKSVDWIMEEIQYYVDNYQVEYIYFIAETFLAMPRTFKEEFYKKYARFNIPFWFNTRPETINEYDIKACADIGCHRISIGIECGNEQYRRKILRRNYSNEAAIKAIEIVAKSPIQFSVNNMIGFPDETRDLIFETIELNRKISADTHTASIFQPFKGTELYKYCVTKGYWSDDRICPDNYYTPAMDMPGLSKVELKGLHRTFSLYVNSNKSEWPRIKQAERLDKDGNMIFCQIRDDLLTK